MLQKYSFFCVFALLLTGLQWWSARVDVSADFLAQMPSGQIDLDELNIISRSDLRRELLETLDRLVVLQNYYRAVYGHYTQVLSNVGFSMPSRLARQYEIRVVAAGKTGFEMAAFSEARGRVEERVWIDQSFRLHANFPLPSPSAAYLKLRASEQLRILRDQDSDRILPEKGIFTGYFRYEIRRDSQNRSVPVAIGAKSPVLGVQLESGSEPSDAFVSTQLTSQILPGEMRQYTKEWAELAEMTQTQLNHPMAKDRRLAALPAPPELARPQSRSDHLIIESLSESRSDSSSHPH